MEDADALFRRGVSEGLSAAALAACLEELKPVLEALSFGEQPQYESLQIEQLRELEPELGFVVRALAGSGAADQKIAGYQLMGLLDREDYVSNLKAGLESAQEWERIEVVHALGRMTQPGARNLLQKATEHPDLQTRRAAIAALRTRSDTR